MVPEARIAGSEHGLVPEGEGWYVLNAREARWRQREGFGRICFLEAEPIPEIFTQLGFQLAVLQAGEPNGMYHRETIPEDFLVVAGECLLVIEGQSGACSNGTSSIARPRRTTSSSARATGRACS